MKTIHKYLLAFAFILLCSVAFNNSYACPQADEKFLSQEDVKNFAPVTPEEADFIDDNNDNQTVDFGSLAPKTPVEADFPDIL